MRSRDLLSIGEVARRSGFAVSAVRYYDEQGLVQAERGPGGRRVFPRHVLRRLAFIRAASRVGLSLEEVRAELDRLPDGRPPDRADWARISRSWRGRLDEEIAALERLRDGLDGCIGCGCLSLASCALYNPGDALADSPDAPGAARLPASLRRASGPRG